MTDPWVTAAVARESLRRAIDPWLTAFVDPWRATDDILADIESDGYTIAPTDAASAAAGSVTLSVDQADDCLDAVEQVVTTFAQAGYREDHGAYTAFRELAEYLRNAIAAAESAEASGEARDGD